MRSNKVLGFAAALALGLAVVSAAVVWAQAPGAAAGRAWGFGFRRLVALNYLGRQLNLTSQQKQQIKDIVGSRKDDIKALVDQGFATRKTLRQAIAGGNSDEIASAATQVSAVELKGAQLRAQLRARIFSDVLQPDQRSKADQLAAQFEQKADRWRQRIEALLDTF
jgi:Spy/CpxP family protein refolding chaperone